MEGFNQLERAIEEALNLSDAIVKGNKIAVTINGVLYYYKPKDTKLSLEDFAKKFNGYKKHSPSRALTRLKKESICLNGKRS